MTQNLKAPKLRFPGFTDDWEQRKLGNIANFINGRAYSQSELQDSGKYKILRVGNFYTNDSWYYSDMELDEKFYANKGDLLYTWSATFGPHIWDGDKVIYHYHIWKIELANSIDKTFAIQLLEKDKANILSNTNGSTMIHITKAGMEEKIVTIPAQIEEQMKIGSFLDKLDNLITLHQRKFETLKKLKKGFLQKMFPKNGESVPEIRFPGFPDAWEQRKLGEITGKVIGGGTPKTCVSEYWDGDIPWIQSSNVQENEMFDFDIPKSITQEGLEKSAAKLVPENSIAVVTHVGVGKLVFVPFSYTTSQDFTSLSELKTDAQFTCYSLYQRIKNDLHIVQGSAIKGITKDDLLSKEIMVPEIQEQRKIGNYFRKLDNLITLHQRKLDTLKKLKQGMLQQMFI